MSKERIIKALKWLGLSNIDVQVYIFLANSGPHTQERIVESLKTKKRMIQYSLKNLQDIEIVKHTNEFPEHYSAMTFKEVLDLFIEVKKEQAKTMKESREELLSSWKALIRK